MHTESCAEGLAPVVNVSTPVLPVANTLTLSQGRRRKIRCIYDDGRNDICQECVLHERECVKQGLVRGSGTHGSASNVKVQVTRLESAVEKLAREKTNSSERNHSTTQDPLDNETIDSTFMEEEWKKHCPIYSLFNNEIVSVQTSPTLLLLTLCRSLKTRQLQYMVPIWQTRCNSWM